jgi:hypothetical protein
MYDQLIATAPSGTVATKLVKALKEVFVIPVTASGTLITKEGTSVHVFGDVHPSFLPTVKTYAEGFLRGASND